jgi:hypothetical protein
MPAASFMLQVREGGYANNITYDNILVDDAIIGSQ